MTYPPPPSGQSPYPSTPPPGQGYGGYSAAPPPAHLRGRTPLRLALIFFIVGLALTITGAVIVGKKSLSAVNSFGRVSIAAGGGNVNFKNTGNYLAYYEANDVDSSISRVPVPIVVLTSPSGKTKQLDTLYGGGSRSSGQIKTKLTYDYNGHRGVAIYQLKIGETGTYRVQVQQALGTAPESKIAFGKSIAGGIALGAGLIVPGVLLLVAALVLLIVGLVKRGRHKKEIAAGGGYGGAPPPGYQYPQQPPPGYQPPPQQQPGYQPPPQQQPGYQPPPQQQQWPAPGASQDPPSGTWPAPQS